LVVATLHLMQPNFTGSDAIVARHNQARCPPIMEVKPGTAVFTGESLLPGTQAGC